MMSFQAHLYASRFFKTRVFFTSRLNDSGSAFLQNAELLSSTILAKLSLLLKIPTQIFESFATLLWIATAKKMYSIYIFSFGLFRWLRIFRLFSYLISLRHFILIMLVIKTCKKSRGVAPNTCKILS